MARTTQRDCAARREDSSHSRSQHRLRDRAIRCDPIHGLVIRIGVKRDRPTRRRRDGARFRFICAGAERRPASSTATAHRELIHLLALRYRLPTIHAFRYFVLDGGLASYGPDTIDIFKRAATYVDRILTGAKPSELPVQAPTKYDLVINLKTAKALGLEMPPSVLALADEVIE